MSTECADPHALCKNGECTCKEGMRKKTQEEYWVKPQDVTLCVISNYQLSKSTSDHTLFRQSCEHRSAQSTTRARAHTHTLSVFMPCALYVPLHYLSIIRFSHSSIINEFFRDFFITQKSRRSLFIITMVLLRNCSRS